MAKKIKVQKPSKSKGRKEIPQDSFNNVVDYNSSFGKVSFEKVCHHKQCSIDEWNGVEFKHLIETFRKIETLTWNQILKDSSLSYKVNKHFSIKLPEDIPEDVNLCSLRVNQKMRIWGYRAQEFFYIVLFDRNHVVCAQNKSKKYS